MIEAAHLLRKTKSGAKAALGLLLLVAVAEELNIREVLSLDRRGFDVYRAKGRERFRVLP